MITELYFQGIERYTEPFPKGDRFILCSWNLLSGPTVEASSNSLEELLKEIPEHLSAETDELSICEVFLWRTDKTDWSDSMPIRISTLFTVNHHDDPMEDDEYDEEIAH